MPPKDGSASAQSRLLTNIDLASIWLATRLPRSSSFPHTEPARLKSQSLASAVASSSVFTRKNDTTGPKNPSRNAGLHASDASDHAAHLLRRTALADGMQAEHRPWRVVERDKFQRYVQFSSGIRTAATGLCAERAGGPRASAGRRLFNLAGPAIEIWPRSSRISADAPKSWANPSNGIFGGICQGPRTV